ncbi:SNF7 family protein [Pimephales promelas]|nr:SNF7 family protein [Pimephales promelas]
MASLFKKKTVDDIIKEQSKELRGTQRQITRDRAALERQERQMTMQTVNKRMDPKKTLQTMQDFQKENFRMGMTEDMLNDTLDEIFDESGDEEECQDIVNQMLDEIGIEISGKMVRAPSTGKILPGASPAKSKAATISDAEIERQLKALGMD